MQLDWISKQEITKQFKRKDLTDIAKANYAIYLMESAYKFGFDEHKNALQNALKGNITLNKEIPTPSYKLK